MKLIDDFASNELLAFSVNSTPPNAELKAFPFQAAPWRRDRHWFAPGAHELLRTALPQRSGGGGWVADFAAVLPSAATAYLRDHQVCLDAIALKSSCVISTKAYRQNKMSNLMSFFPAHSCWLKFDTNHCLSILRVCGWDYSCVVQVRPRSEISG